MRSHAPKQCRFLLCRQRMAESRRQLIYQVQGTWPSNKEPGGGSPVIWENSGVHACGGICDLVYRDRYIQKNTAHVTLSPKMRLALPVGIPESCFFDQQATAMHDKNSNGDLRGFPNWDCKISRLSLSISEHCKKKAQPQSDLVFSLFPGSSIFGRIDMKWVTLMRAGARYVNSNLFQWEVPAFGNKVSWRE